MQVVVLTISGLGWHEIFIAADIISSAVSPSWEKVGILVAIVGLPGISNWFSKLLVIGLGKNPTLKLTITLNRSNLKV